jgi:type I restriction enzyme, S subunit
VTDIVREKFSTFQEGTLPSGWTTATIGELIALEGKFIDGDWVESKDQDPLGEVRLIQLADIGDGEYRDRSARFLTLGKAKELGCTFLETEDVLIARMPDPLGRACIFPGDIKPSVTVVDVCIVRTGEEGPNHRWLMYTINSPAFRSAVANLQSGTTRQRISRSNLAILEIPVPPIAEQQRIVSAIEQQFTRLDAGVAALRRAQAKLKRYRAAVLKAAVEGKLTEEWRAEHPTTEPASILLERILKERRARWETDLKAKGKDLLKVKYVEPAKPDMENLPELTEGWCWATVGQAVLRSEYGTSVKCDYGVQGIPVLRIPNIAAGEIDLSDMKYCTKPININEDDSLQIGDLLVCRTNGSISLIGKTALVRVPLEPYHTFASYLLRFRLFETKILPKWLHLFLSSPQGRAFIERNAASSAGQHNISLTLIHGMEFPVPPLAEQEQIVAEVEQRLSVVDQLEWIVEANLKRAERLRQSILQQAFAGRLVPQDPNDEPASVLLERIRKEREGRKNGIVGNGRYVRVSSEPVEIDVEGTRQVELWEGVGGGE